MNKQRLSIGIILMGTSFLFLSCSSQPKQFSKSFEGRVTSGRSTEAVMVKLNKDGDKLSGTFRSKAQIDSENINGTIDGKGNLTFSTGKGFVVWKGQFVSPDEIRGTIAISADSTSNFTLEEVWYEPDVSKASEGEFLPEKSPVKFFYDEVGPDRIIKFLKNGSKLYGSEETNPNSDPDYELRGDIDSKGNFKLNDEGGKPVWTGQFKSKTELHLVDMQRSDDGKPKTTTLKRAG